VWAAALVAGAGPAVGAPVQPRVFYVQADGHVSAAAPKTSFERHARLELRRKPALRAYVRFRVHGLGGPAAQATLRVRTLAASRAGFEVHAVGRGWRSQRLTYRAAPRLGGRIGSSGRFAAGRWISVDVTRALRGNGVLTLALTTRSAGRVRLASANGARWAVPRLEVREAQAARAAPAAEGGAAPRLSLGNDALIPPMPPPQATVAPQITGRAWEKRELSATQGVWAGAPSAFEYQWRRCDGRGGSCEDIPGAKDVTYTLDSKDVGSTARVTVRAINAGGEGTATSEPTDVIIKAPPMPTVRKSPSISGRAQEGLVLTLRPGEWKGGDPITFAYQWQRCDAKGRACGDVEGATATTYDVTAPDLSSTLRAVVTARNVAGSTTVTTKPTDKVTPPPPPPMVGVVGLWHMDETSGSTMLDSSGLGNNGRLRSVVLNQPGFIGAGYYFNGSSSVASIPSNASLNPGFRDFSFGLNLRFTSRPSGTVDTWDPMRKGYSDSTGGDFKMEIYPSGQVSCYFKGSFGNARVTNNRDLADGTWHTVTCGRRGGSVTLEVDGRSFSDSGAVGAIANTAPLMVGARTSGMEFFRGYIDEAHMTVE
jgi:hypothetical protein